MDQRQWHLRYNILKNKKFDVKKLILKISEEITIVIIWPLQMLILKGSRYVPVGSLVILCSGLSRCSQNDT